MTVIIPLYPPSSGWDMKIHESVRKGDLRNVKKWVKRRNQVEAKGDVGGYGYTPLHLAVYCGKSEIAKWLLQEAGAYADVKDDHGHVPLHLACATGNVAMTQLLLNESSLGILYQDTRQGLTPLHIASWQGHLEIVKLLLEAKTSYYRSYLFLDNKGQTAEDYARQQNHADIVSLFEIEEPLHRTIQEAAISCDLNLVQFMVRRHGPEIINTKGEHDGTALYWACYNGELEMVKWLLQNGAEVDSVNEWGSTPLFPACRTTRYIKVVQCLLEHGADVGIQNNDGETPLLHGAQAVPPGWYKTMVPLLLPKHQGTTSLINQQDKEGCTVLHYACRNGNVEDVQFLVQEQGAKIYVRDRKGKTPQDWVWGNHVEILDFLKEAARRQFWKNLPWILVPATVMIALASSATWQSVGAGTTSING